MRIAALGALLLTGCGTACDTPDEQAAGVKDTCNAAAYQALIGENGEAGASLPDPKRIYQTGDPVTLDYNPERLNIKLDDTGKIVEIDCG
jgi:hypothetical protein